VFLTWSLAAGKKKLQKFYKNAVLLRKYRKIKDREVTTEDVASEADEDAAAPKDETRRRTKGPKPLPYAKEFSRAQKAREETEVLRSATARDKAAAEKNRKQQRKLATSRTSKGQPRMRDRMQVLLAKLQQDSA